MDCGWRQWLPLPIKESGVWYDRSSSLLWFRVTLPRNKSHHSNLHVNQSVLTVRRPFYLHACLWRTLSVDLNKNINHMGLYKSLLCLNAKRPIASKYFNTRSKLFLWIDLITEHKIVRDDAVFVRWHLNSASSPKRSLSPARWTRDSKVSLNSRMFTHHHVWTTLASIAN